MQSGFWVTRGTGTGGVADGAEPDPATVAWPIVLARRVREEADGAMMDEAVLAQERGGRVGDLLADHPGEVADPAPGLGY